MNPLLFLMIACLVSLIPAVVAKTLIALLSGVFVARMVFGACD